MGAAVAAEVRLQPEMLERIDGIVVNAQPVTEPPRAPAPRDTYMPDSNYNPSTRGGAGKSRAGTPGHRSPADLSTEGTIARYVEASGRRTVDLADRVAELEMRLRRIAAEVLAARVVDQALPGPVMAGPPPTDDLTPRQSEIMRRFLEGQRVSTIAAELYVNPSTVRNHLAAIFRKYGVHSQPELLELLARRRENAEVG